MKKIILIFLILCLIIPFAFADNSQRIQELKQEKEELQSRSQQYRQILQNIDIRIIEINGIIKELEKQDQETKKEEQAKKEQDEKTDTIDSVPVDNK